MSSVLEAAASGSPDVVVHLQHRPEWAGEPLDPERVLQPPLPDEEDDGALLDAGTVRSGRGTRIRFAEGATFWISAGDDEVWFEYAAPLTAADAEYFLFEPVLGFVLRSRGVLALHASAVEIDGRAVLFCGSPGAGKSTTAAACLAQGHRLLSDDVVALGLAEGRWIAHRGTGSIRLWDDGLAALGRDAEHAPLFSPTWPKRLLPTVGTARSVAAIVPVGLVCLFAARDANPRASAEPVVGATALRELIAHTTANRLHDAVRRAVELRQLAQLVESVPVVRLHAPADGARLPELVAAIRVALDG